VLERRAFFTCGYRMPGVSLEFFSGLLPVSVTNSSFQRGLFGAPFFGAHTFIFLFFPPVCWAILWLLFFWPPRGMRIILLLPLLSLGPRKSPSRPGRHLRPPSLFPFSRSGFLKHPERGLKNSRQCSRPGRRKYSFITLYNPEKGGPLFPLLTFASAPFSAERAGSGFCSFFSVPRGGFLLPC